jgi:hypothetical protein
MMHELLCRRISLAACFRWTTKALTDIKVRLLMRAEATAANNPKSSEPTKRSKMTDLKLIEYFFISMLM